MQSTTSCACAHPIDAKCFAPFSAGTGTAPESTMCRMGIEMHGGGHMFAENFPHALARASCSALLCASASAAAGVVPSPRPCPVSGWGKTSGYCRNSQCQQHRVFAVFDRQDFLPLRADDKHTRRCAGQPARQPNPIRLPPSRQSGEAREARGVGPLLRFAAQAHQGALSPWSVSRPEPLQGQRPFVGFRPAPAEARGSALTLLRFTRSLWARAPTPYDLRGANAHPDMRVTD